MDNKYEELKSVIEEMLKYAFVSGNSPIHSIVYTHHLEELRQLLVEPEPDDTEYNAWLNEMHKNIGRKPDGME